MPDALPYRRKPCPDCPWRKDSPVGQFPPERYEALAATAGRRGNEAGLTAPIFACHQSTQNRDQACAGWLAQVGGEHLGIRMAVATGRIPGDALAPGDDWPELFDTYEEMAERNGVEQWT